jgi:hypothetical protein
MIRAPAVPASLSLDPIMPPRNTKRAALVLAIGAMAVIAATPAGATGYACAVERTSDGFVALRNGPSARHQMIARMRPQELVNTMDEVTEDRVISGNWIRVTWYAGTRRTAFSIPDMSRLTGRVGWVHYGLINCFE